MRKLSAVLLGFLIALGSLVMTSSPAAADHSSNPNVEGMGHVQTFHETACGVASVTLKVPEGTPEWVYRLQVEVDGVVTGNTELVKGPGTSTLDLSFEEDEGDGSVIVSYYFLDAQEWDIVDADMNYQSTYPEVGEAFKSFEVATDCVTPTPTPTATASPDPTPSATPSPSESAAQPTPTQSPIDKQAVSGNLPVTGSKPLVLVGGGVGLLAVGALLFLLGRRRRNPAPS